jgi:CRP-like cAMP-binding protein
MKLKIAQTAEELDDVFWLRHQVYILEDGKYGGKPLRNQRIVDRFDAFPESLNIIAYDAHEPVGTMRIGLDAGLGLAAEEYFDFVPFRQQAAARWREEYGRSTVDACPSMLAIRKQWKNRRDVIRALLKMAIGVWHSWGVTHVYASVNHDTVGMYKRLGYRALAEKQWIESIGNYIVPIQGSFANLYEWAFGYLQDDLLDAYSGHFERLLLKPGEVLFKEGDLGDHAYMVDEGAIKVSRNDNRGCELNLANLEQGELFGELALIDTHPRSAMATAMKATELIVLDRKTFQERLATEPRLMDLVMNNFSKRIRQMDDLAMVLAYGASTQRLNYALNTLRKAAKPDIKMPNIFVAKISPKELANSAGVSEQSAMVFLQSRKDSGELDYSTRSIRFYDRRSLASPPNAAQGAMA